MTFHIWCLEEYLTDYAFKITWVPQNIHPHFKDNEMERFPTVKMFFSVSEENNSSCGLYKKKKRGCPQRRKEAVCCSMYVAPSSGETFTVGKFNLEYLRTCAWFNKHVSVFARRWSRWSSYNIQRQFSLEITSIKVATINLGDYHGENALSIWQISWKKVSWEITSLCNQQKKQGERSAQTETFFACE